MDFEKLTSKSKEIIESVVNLAAANKNQYITPLHLLKILLNGKYDIVLDLISRAGGDITKIRDKTDAQFERLPNVAGSSVQTMMSQEFTALMMEAEKLADKANDKFVTVERLLQALSVTAGNEAYDILISSGVNATKLNQAINAVSHVFQDYTDVEISSSVGVSFVTSKEKINYNTYIFRVEQALLKAKDNGYNDIEVYREILDIDVNNKPVILLAMPSQVARDILKEALSDNFSIMETDNLRNLEDILQSHYMNLSLVLLDSDITEDIIKLLKRIEDVNEYKSVGKIMLSHDIKLEIQALSYGFDDFILKPFDPETTLIRISNVIKSKKNENKI